MKLPRQKIFYDLVIFQAGWFCCVLCTLSPFPILLPMIGFIPVLIRSVYTQGLFILFPFALTSLVLGLVGDAWLVHLGLISFGEYPSILGVPYWMLILWLNFALMLRPLFKWFLDEPWRCLFGFSIGGVVAYYSGHQFEVLTFEQGWNSAFAVAIEWGFAGFVLRFLHLEFDTQPKIL